MAGKIALFVLLVLAVTVSPAEAQQTKKIPARIGYLSVNYLSATGVREQIEAFQQGLRELGYVEGKTIAIEYRFAEENVDRLPDLAAELVRLKVDLIVVQSTPAALAAKAATTTIPIVIAGGTDPVATGVVASLAKPGENITGVTIMNAELAGKRLELLKETSPKVLRVGVLWNPTNRGAAVVFKQTKAASEDLALQLQSLEVKGADDLGSAFKAATGSGANALVLLAGNPLGTHLKEIAQLIDAGKIKPIVTEVRPLTDAIKTQQQAATHHTRGKVVLRIADEVKG